MNQRYIKPGKATMVFNWVVVRLIRLGISVAGSRELRVRGRKTGQIRRVPVNVLKLDGERYLIAPRGHAQWVRNLRAAGEGELRVGRRPEPFTATELGDDEKLPMLREYLRRWAWEVKAFLGDLTVDSPDEDLRAAAPGFPVFRINRG
ncbi:nitroreductase family deazaflavin-dependent oxidoreductase [Thermocrispum municipale]|jgi:deazaflavin-dependent oxidoreductase (nitroreductase family)|uniref:nitroreductase family deazaflavin-dependent oxidoreductase n=1 Tax=Thermocrispum municipale TaxID=37926 RepID=UPI000405AD12|nr:nitroreductase family deazaflavin-dependent oxidoreductase [Thermocrispum municipale]